MCCFLSAELWSVFMHLGIFLGRNMPVISKKGKLSPTVDKIRVQVRTWCIYKQNVFILEKYSSLKSAAVFQEAFSSACPDKEVQIRQYIDW
jgi:hypothetical protein